MDFDILRRATRPLTLAQIEAVVRERTAGSRGECLTLEDAGLADEVRRFLDTKLPPGDYTEEVN